MFKHFLLLKMTITAFLSVVLLSFSIATTAQDLASDDPEGAISFLEGLAEETKTAWSDSTLTEIERDTVFKSIFAKASDLNLIGRAMLGRHYRAINAAQKQAYTTAVEAFIISELDKNMAQIGFKDLNVTGSVAAPGKRGHIYIRTKIDREEGEPIKADWRIRKKAGAFQIVNLEVEGINLIITNREIFSSRIKALGMDDFIIELAGKNRLLAE